MKQKISVVSLVKASLIQKKTHMVLQFLAVTERGIQAFHHIFFLWGKFIWLFPVDRRKICIGQRIFFSVRKCDRSLFRIDPLKQAPVFHMELFVPADQLAFQFKLDDGDGLMHLPSKLFFQNTVVIGISLHLKNSAGIIFISFHCKGCQRHEIDSISILQDIHVPVADTVSDHGCNAGFLACGSAHPDYIVISPLDIQRVVFHQTVHDKMRARTSIINISQNMKMIHNQTLDQFCQGNDKILCPADLNDGVDDSIVICLFVQDFRFFCNQLLDHIGIIRRECFTHLGSGIFGCRCLAHFDQTIKGDLVPVLHIFFMLFHNFHLFLGIIDQCGKRTFVAVT